MRTVIVLMLAVSGAADLGAATRTWTGAAGTKWTIASNWSGGSAPVAGDDLVFPAGALNQNSTNNDFPANTTFNSISFTGGSYSLNGNPITIGAGGIHTALSAGAAGFEVHAMFMPLTLGAPQTWVLVSGKSGVGLPTSVDLNGMALTISGSGSSLGPVIKSFTGPGSITLSGSGIIILTLTGASTTTAPFTATNAALTVVGTYPGPITVGDNASLREAPGATVGTVTVTGAGAKFAPAGASPPNGAPSSGNIILGPGTEFDASINNASGFSGVNVNGTVNLGGSDLKITTGTTMVPNGTAGTIINNDGSDPVVGTFRGLPEGGQIVAGTSTPQVFSVSYVGGTGNDVVITALAAPVTSTTTTLTTSATPSAFGGAVTLTAKVTATSGIPTGSVDFRDGNNLLATVPLDATGTATFTTSSLTPGTHRLTAAYGATNPPFAPSTSASLTQGVNPRRRRAVH